jgi:hypothetical protein
MREDSPTRFIKIRTPRPPKPDPYATALELAGAIHRVLEGADKTRFHLKDRLDRCITSLILQLARLNAVAKRGRWTYYRTAQNYLVDALAVLDILLAHKVNPRDDIEAARTLAKRLSDELEPLAMG